MNPANFVWGKEVSQGSLQRKVTPGQGFEG